MNTSCRINIWNTPQIRHYAGVSWGSIQELELAQPEVPGGAALFESSTGLWTVPASLIPFLLSPVHLWVVVSFELLGFFSPSFSFVCILYTAVFWSCSITAAHCLPKSHSLISQMIRNPLVGNCVHIKEHGQEGVSNPWAKKPSILTETVDRIRNTLWHYVSCMSQKNTFLHVVGHTESKFCSQTHFRPVGLHFYSFSPSSQETFPFPQAGRASWVFRLC